MPIAHIPYNVASLLRRSEGLLWRVLRTDFVCLVQVFLRRVCAVARLGLKILQVFGLAFKSKVLVKDAGEVSPKTDNMIGTSLPYARAEAGPKDSFGEDLRQPSSNSQSHICGLSIPRVRK